MKKVLAIIGEGQFSDRQIKSLQVIIAQNYRINFNDDKVVFIWNKVPLHYLKNSESNSYQSNLTIECELACEDDYKVRMMESCLNDWTMITKQLQKDVIINFISPSNYNKLFFENNYPQGFLRRARLISWIAIQLAYSYITKRYFSFRTSSRNLTH